MYYNKQKVEKLLNEGLSEPVDVVEDLYEFINEIFDNFWKSDDDDVIKMYHLSNKWGWDENG